MSVAADATTGNAQRALGAKTAGLRPRPLADLQAVCDWQAEDWD